MPRRAALLRPREPNQKAAHPNDEHHLRPLHGRRRWAHHRFLAPFLRLSSALLSPRLSSALRSAVVHRRTGQETEAGARAQLLCFSASLVLCLENPKFFKHAHFNCVYCIYILARLRRAYSAQYFPEAGTIIGLYQWPNKMPRNFLLFFCLFSALFLLFGCNFGQNLSAFHLLFFCFYSAFFLLFFCFAGGCLRAPFGSFLEGREGTLHEPTPPTWATLTCYRNSCQQS